MTPLYPIPLTLNDGTATDFGMFKGKVVMVVNVASNCGFTPQYAGLETLYEKFLVSREGEIVGRFAPTVEPDSAEVIDAIENALG